MPRHISRVAYGVATFAIASYVNAMNPLPITFEFGSEAFWNDWDIAVAGVSKPVDPDAKTVVLKIKEQFSGEKEPTKRNVLATQILIVTLGNKPTTTAATQNALQEGDEVLVGFRHDNPMVLVCKLSSPTDGKYAATAKEISAVRLDKTDTKLKDGVFSENQIVAEYCVHCLVSKKATSSDTQFARKLVALRDDKSKQVPFRLTTNRLSLLYSDNAKEQVKNSEAWLMALLATELDDAADVRNIVSELCSTLNSREDRVALLIGIAHNEGMSLLVRQVAAVSLGSPQCFDFDHSDSAASQNALAFIKELLSSNKAELRQTAGFLFRDVCLSIRDARQIEECKRAISSLAKAAEVEKDDKTAEVMNVCQKRLKIVIADKAGK